MEVNRLTDIEVKKAKAKDKPYAMSDGAGLYLWVTTAGGKLWRWGYRFDGREKPWGSPKSGHRGSAQNRP
jgi:hypothetical protein